MLFRSPVFKVKERLKYMNDFDPPTNTPVTIVDLKHDGCRYIVSEVDGGDTLYCNADEYKASFCGYHYKLCYTPLKKSEAA